MVTGVYDPGWVRVATDQGPIRAASFSAFLLSETSQQVTERDEQLVMPPYGQDVQQPSAALDQIMNVVAVSDASVGGRASSRATAVNEAKRSTIVPTGGSKVA